MKCYNSLIIHNQIMNYILKDIYHIIMIFFLSRSPTKKLGQLLLQLNSLAGELKDNIVRKGNLYINTLYLMYI